MNLLNMDQVTGGRVDLQRTNPNHLKGSLSKEVTSKSGNSDFGGMVLDALNDVNGLVQESSSITEQYIIDPDSVDVHDVTIAMGKANLAISMTKSVVDGAIKAYREIINIR